MPTTKYYRVKLANYCGTQTYSTPISLSVCEQTVEYAVNAELYLNQSKTFNASTFFSSPETLTYSWSRRTFVQSTGCKTTASTTSLGTAATATTSVTNLNDYNTGGQLCPPRLYLTVTNPCGTSTLYSSYFYCPVVEKNDPPTTATGTNFNDPLSYPLLDVATNVSAYTESNQTYQWQFSTTSGGTYSNITTGGTTSTYRAKYTGYYRCVIDNNCTTPITSSVTAVTITNWSGGGTINPPGNGTFP